MFKEYFNKPITRGDVVKSNIKGLLVSGMILAGTWVYTLYTDRNYYRDKWLNDVENNICDDLENQKTEL